MFELLFLFSLIGVAYAIHAVYSEHKRRKEAEDSWRNFNKKND